MANEIDKVAEALGITRKTTDVIEKAPDNSKRWTNGMDNIDNWAAGIGNAERKSKAFQLQRPNKPHNANNNRR